MTRRVIFCFILVCIIGFSGFGQASGIRDYVGMISQSFHPDIVSFMEKFKADLEKRNYTDAAKSVDNYLKGESGTGFVYVADDGQNYIITNYHVISQAHTLSISFEKADGDRTRFSDLSIIAADEDMDIALLAFAGGQKPFNEGLSFLDRPVQEGEDVRSAGFPGLGTAMVWQLGGGMISNASVRLPDPDDDTKRIGPYIQHTAQVDPGNSGGPLLVQIAGVPTGFSVAGINTLSARFRQAANFSIPINRVRTFLDESLKPQTEDSRPNTRVDAFIGGLGASKAVYSHIAEYLSNVCTGENAEYALSEVFEKAPRTVQNEIVQAFVHSPVDGMAYAVAWTIENALRDKAGKISITTDSVNAAGDDKYTVVFNVNGKNIDSEWVNEYGIWRIRTFGAFAAGDKSLVKKKVDDRELAGKLRLYPNFQISIGFVQIIDGSPAVGANILLRNNWAGYGLRAYFSDITQVDFMIGGYFPIKAGQVAFTPFGNVSLGIQFNDEKDSDDIGFNFPDMAISFQGGLQFTAAAVPGLFLQVAYQYSVAFGPNSLPYDQFLFIGLGYSF